MKKIIITLLFVAGSLGMFSANAQAKPADKKSAATTTTSAATTKKLSKKDGTPDMRMKENKIAAAKTATPGPTKKDGTADMRYKANKKAK